MIKKKILIVEDEESLLKLESILLDLGLEAPQGAPASTAGSE